MRLHDRVRVKPGLCLGEDDTAARGTIIAVDDVHLEFFIRWDDEFEDDAPWSEDELELLEETGP